MIISGKKTLWWTQAAWQQMWTLTKACDIEISALGLVAEDDPNLVEEFFVVKQLNSATLTEMDPAAVTDLIMQLRSQGINQNRLRVWWHSHVKMDTALSGTDEDNIERYASDYLWSVVTCHQDAERVFAGLAPTKLNIRCDTFDPRDAKNVWSPLRFTHEGCNYGVEYLDVTGDEWANEQIKEKVTRKVIASKATTYGVNSYGVNTHWRSDYDVSWTSKNTTAWGGIRDDVPVNRTVIQPAPSSAKGSAKSSKGDKGTAPKKKKKTREVAVPSEKMNLPHPLLHSLYELGFLLRGEALYYTARTKGGALAEAKALADDLLLQYGTKFSPDDQLVFNSMISAFRTHHEGNTSVTDEVVGEDEPPVFFSIATALMTEEEREKLSVGLKSNAVKTMFIKGMITSDEATAYDDAVTAGSLTEKGVLHAIESGEGWDGQNQGAKNA